MGGKGKKRMKTITKKKKVRIAAWLKCGTHGIYYDYAVGCPMCQRSKK
jgi:hypothetical protein